MSTDTSFLDAPETTDDFAPERPKLSILPNIAQPEPQTTAPDVKIASDKIGLAHQAVNKMIKDLKLSGSTRTDIEIVGSLCRETILALLCVECDDFAKSIALAAKANEILALTLTRFDDSKLTQPTLLSAIAKANELLEKAWNSLIPAEED